MPPLTSCKPMFAGLLSYIILATTPCTTRTPHVRNVPRRLNRPPRPLPVTPMPTLPTWKSHKALPCPGNVVCWRLAPPTMLPGHGSTFLCLPHQQHTMLLSPYTVLPTPSRQRHRKCQNTQGRQSHTRGSHPSRPPIAVGCLETNRGGSNAPSAIDFL